MDAVSVIFSAVATVSILLAIPLLAILGRRAFWAGGADARGIALVAAIGAAVTALAYVAHVVPIPALLVAPVLALGALFATLAASASFSPSGWRQSAFAAIATAAVFLPVSVSVFGGMFDPFATQLGVIDFGGGIPVFVVGGGISAGVIVAGGRAAVPGRSAPGVRSLLWPTLLLWLASAAWLVCLELAADDMVPTILTSAVVMPPAAALAAAVVERLRSRRNTASAIVRGTLAGIAAAAPACAFVIPPIAVSIGLLVGAVSAMLSPRVGSSVPVVLGIGAGISAVLLGAVATNFGLIYTGQPELIFGQTAIVLLAGGGGLIAGAVLTRVLGPRRR